MDAILDLADKAARCVLRGYPDWTAQDWEDARQEAATAICAYGTDHHEGTLFLHAKHAIIDWIRRWRRWPRGGELWEWRDYTQEQGSDAPCLHACLDTLALMLETQRAKKPDEDIRYLHLLLQGYSTDGIAMEMGLSRRNVYAIRERLLPRLERLARGEQATYRVNVRTSSYEALDRINHDPMMLARRAQAIRDGWARRKAFV